MSATLLLVAALALPPQYLEVRHSGDYGPGGDGPSFTLNLSTPGVYRFSCHRWLLSDGQYLLDLTPSDAALVMAVVDDLQATSPDPPEFWVCPHSPDFGVFLLSSSPPHEFASTVCVSRVQSSRFAFLFALVTRLATTHCVPVRLIPPRPGFEIIDTRDPRVGIR